MKSVGLGNVNGVTLAYTSGTGQGNASATKNGNSYKITGTAIGVDMANPMAAGEQAVRNRCDLLLALLSLDLLSRLRAVATR